MSKKGYKHGDFNVICDKTGFKVKASETRMMWDGTRVWNRVWEERHPLDTIRSVVDDQSVENPRSEASDSFGTYWILSNGTWDDEGSWVDGAIWRD